MNSIDVASNATKCYKNSIHFCHKTKKLLTF